MTYTRPITANLLTSGLGAALGYTVKSFDGSTTLIARTTSGISEDSGTGIYQASVANWDASWSGWIVWDAGAGTLAREEFQAPRLSPTGLDAIPGWTTWTLPQSIRAMTAFQQSERTGVVEGSSGTMTLANGYGTVSYDTNGNILDNSVTPPL